MTPISSSPSSPSGSYSSRYSDCSSSLSEVPEPCLLSPYYAPRPLVRFHQQVPKSSEGIIDMEVFQQIRDMDIDDEDGDEEEEEEEGFSRGIVFGYFEQAEQCFKDMESAM